MHQVHPTINRTLTTGSVGLDNPTHLIDELFSPPMVGIVNILS